MKEKTFWIFNGIALAAMYSVPQFPLLAVLVLGVCITLCAISFVRDRDEPGNPAFGLLGSFLVFLSIYSMLIYPNVVLGKVPNLLLDVSMWLGCGLWAFWIYKVSWRKREATLKQSTTLNDTNTDND